MACWAHFRRKVFDLHERVPTPLSTDILEQIGALYAVEAEVRGQPPDARHHARQERSRPLVDALREVLDAGLRRLSPKSDMAKAIAYGTRRWPALSRFLEDGRLEIDNNIAERALRRPALEPERRAVAALRSAVRRAVADLGYAEAVTWSFVPPEQAAGFGAAEPVLKRNPLNAELSAMRPSLLPNLIAALVLEATTPSARAAVASPGRSRASRRAARCSVACPSCASRADGSARPRT